MEELFDASFLGVEHQSGHVIVIYFLRPSVVMMGGTKEVFSLIHKGMVSTNLRV